MQRPDNLRRRSSSRHVKSPKRRIGNPTTLYKVSDSDRSDEQDPNSSQVSIWGLDVDDRTTYAVDFEGPNDPTNPLNWPESRKWIVVTILSLAGLVANLGTLMCVPAVPQILEYFDSTSSLYETSLVSAWEIGMAIGPLFVAPLSEIFGRAPVYNAANVWFMVMALGCGASQNLQMLLAFRLLNGIGDSSQSLNAGIVGDMFVQEKRGLAVAITSLPPMLGPIAGENGFVFGDDRPN